MPRCWQVFLRIFTGVDDPLELDYAWEDLLRTADLNGDGDISKAELLQYCLGDEPLTPGGDFEDEELAAHLSAALAELRAAAAAPGAAQDGQAPLPPKSGNPTSPPPPPPGLSVDQSCNAAAFLSESGSEDGAERRQGPPELEEPELEPIRKEEPEPDPVQADSDDALWAELAQLRMSALKKRAVAEGVGKEELEEAEDGDAPKEKIISLVLARQATTPAGGAARGGDDALRAELAQLRMSALKKRAVAEGVGEEELEEAGDSEEPKAAIILLLLAHSTGR
jgi:hypothetical protein